jgi:hypothetical protein
MAVGQTDSLFYCLGERLVSWTFYPKPAEGFNLSLSKVSFFQAEQRLFPLWADERGPFNIEREGS